MFLPSQPPPDLYSSRLSTILATSAWTRYPLAVIGAVPKRSGFAEGVIAHICAFGRLWALDAVVIAVMVMRPFLLFEASRRWLFGNFSAGGYYFATYAFQPSSYSQTDPHIGNLPEAIQSCQGYFANLMKRIPAPPSLSSAILIATSGQSRFLLAFQRPQSAMKAYHYRHWRWLEHRCFLSSVYFFKLVCAKDPSFRRRIRNNATNTSRPSPMFLYIAPS